MIRSTKSKNQDCFAALLPHPQHSSLASSLYNSSTARYAWITYLKLLHNYEKISYSLTGYLIFDSKGKHKYAGRNVKFNESR